jgi:hypothetical protein
MYEQFMLYDGLPVVNSHRTSAYAEALGLGSWFTGRADSEGIGPVLGETYTTPAADLAPWYDSRFADTADFAGFEIISMTPLLSHTQVRSTTPLLKGGAVISPAYHAAREMVFRGILIGKTRASVVRGFGWLRHVLEYGAECDFDIDCDGKQMMMWTQAPEEGLGIGDEELYRRYLYGVQLAEGPPVLRERDLAGGCGSMIEVEFTLTSNNPYIYGQSYSISVGSGSGTTYADLEAAFPTYEDVAAVGTYIEVLNYLWTDGASTGTAPADPPPDTIPPEHFDPDCPIPPVLPTAPQNTDLS